MCQQVLSAADLKAICKSRGFSAQEAASRAVFENYFLSDIGLEAALTSLSREEIIVLHLLKWQPQTVDIRFFECLFPSKHGWRSSFTQRYSPVLKTVQNALVRKGVLLMAVASGSATKMERWRFRLPEAFEPFLPSIFPSTARFSVTGKVNQAILRQKMMAILENRRSSSLNDPRVHPVTLDNGQLLIGKQPFTVNELFEWRQDYWQRSVWAPRQQQDRQKDGKLKVWTAADLEAKRIEDKPFPPLLYYAFSQLADEEWIYWDELSPLLRLFYHGATLPDSRVVCEAGWKLGCLAKHTVQTKDYYRLAPSQAMEDKPPSSYLASSADAFVTVDLETIPYQSLEHLNAMTDLQVVDARLLAMPNAIKLGRASEVVWQHPLTAWFRKHAMDFRKVIEMVEARRGKQIIHANLLLARVKDLTLKVALQKAFPKPDQLMLLPNDFIAFPRELLADMQRLVGKSGYVVKTIRVS
jgi:hypothetical protein